MQFTQWLLIREAKKNPKLEKSLDKDMKQEKSWHPKKSMAKEG